LLPPPPPPPPVVEEGFGDDLVPEVDMDGLPVCNVVELEIATVGGLVGVASGSLPAACASTGSNPGLYTRWVRYTQESG
jgi:hypothetical protein